MTSRVFPATMHFAAKQRIKIVAGLYAQFSVQTWTLSSQNKNV